MKCWALAVDWSATGNMLAGIGALLAGFATIALAIVGAKGIGAWKAQAAGTRRLDLTQDLLGTVYEIQEVLRFVLLPMVGPDELARVERASGETDIDFEARNTFAAVNLRYQDHVDRFNALRALAFRARATLGDPVYEAVLELILFPKTIWAAGATAVNAKKRLDHIARRSERFQVSEKEYNEAFDAVEKAEDRFWARTESGTLMSEVEDKVKKCEQLLREELSRYNLVSTSKIEQWWAFWR